jgi:hypothetical protein
MKKAHLLSLTLSPALLLALIPVFAAEHAHEKPKRTPSPKGAKVYIVSPRDGQTVKRKFKVIFGLTGMGVCPAGLTAADGTPLPDTGHHHLLVNVDKLPPLDTHLASDQPEKILHFGKGQTETMLELPPGKHTLQLVFADYAHVPHDPPLVSEKITVTVKD